MKVSKDSKSMITRIWQLYLIYPIKIKFNKVIIINNMKYTILLLSSLTYIKY